MYRRNFLTALGAGLASGSFPLPALPPARNGKLKITAVEIWKLDGHREAAASDGQHQTRPLDVYEEYRPKPRAKSGAAGVRKTAPVSALYLKIKTDQGVEGLYGPIDKESAVVVVQQLRAFVTGRDPLAGEAVWDQMYRSNRHSRHGYFLMAISAVDNALWDLRGRYYQSPVYRLLGGPTRTSVEAYASCAGFSHEPEVLRKRALQFKDEGFRYEKWFLSCGPGDGPEGIQKNVDLVRNLREAVGDNFGLMFDAFSSWDLTYALEWAKRVEQYHPHWIEEAFHPEKIESFATLRRSISFPVASGEHIYGRWEAEEYLKAGALNILQTDPEWCGGVSELVKICTAASLHDVQVIPHGHSIHAAMHVVASQSPMTCPLVEYLITKMSSYYHFEKEPPHPVRGKIALPDRPGFGVELDPAKVEKQTEMKWA